MSTKSYECNRSSRSWSFGNRNNTILILHYYWKYEFYAEHVNPDYWTFKWARIFLSVKVICFLIFGYTVLTFLFSTAEVYLLVHLQLIDKADRLMTFTNILLNFWTEQNRLWSRIVFQYRTLAFITYLPSLSYLAICDLFFTLDDIYSGARFMITKFYIHIFWHIKLINSTV